MFIDDEICSKLETYVNSRGEKVELKPHERTVNVEDVVRGDGLVIWCCTPPAKKKKGIRWSDLNIPEAESFIKDFAEKRLHGYTTLNSAARHAMTETEKLAFWNALNKYLVQAESNLGLPPDTLVLFTPEKLPVYHRPYADEGGHSYDGTVGFRKSTNAAFDGNLRSDRRVSNPI